MSNDDQRLTYRHIVEAGQYYGVGVGRIVHELCAIQARLSRIDAHIGVVVDSNGYIHPDILEDLEQNLNVNEWITRQEPM